LHPAPTIEDEKTSKGTLKDSIEFFSMLTSLNYKTKYFVRSYAINNAGISYGHELEINTKALLPVIESYTQVDTTFCCSFFIFLKVTSNGGSPITNQGICWSLVPNPTISDFVNSAPISDLNAYSGWIASPLDASTAYYIRAFAQNIAGITYGKEYSYTTRSAKIPSVEFDYPEMNQIGSVSMMVWNWASGGSEVFEKGVCYSELVYPTIADNKVEIFEPGVNTVNLNLLPLTHYYIRGYAINSIGVGYSRIAHYKMPKSYIQLQYILAYNTSVNTFLKNIVPNHIAVIDSLYISDYEVSNNQYCIFLNDLGVSADGTFNGEKLIDLSSNTEIMFSGSFYCNAAYKDFPVRYITWKGAHSYSEWIGGHLPTEAEWEYIARGTVLGAAENTKYCRSNDLNLVGWYSSNSGNKTHKTGLKFSNIQVYDMSGNVREWCSDWYDPDYYSNSPIDNPQGPATGTYKVVRGGSYLTGEEKCRVYTRDYASPDTCSADIGFRVVIPLNE
jgi:hypothetical protein